MTELQGEYERIREGGRERLLHLSQPKEPKTEWYTSVGPLVRWGTQEMIWPIKRPTLEREPSERIIALSTPKPNFLQGDKITRPDFYYSCGRSSVIWDVKPAAKEARATGRLKLLAEPKKLHKEYKENIPQYSYSCGRESPLWDVKREALSCGDRPITQQLARHKEPHPHFTPEKPVQTQIPPSALKSSASERLLYLSTPKERPEGPFRSPAWESALQHGLQSLPPSPKRAERKGRRRPFREAGSGHKQWNTVANNAKNASASTRCLELARPKGVVDGYQLPREVEWPVPRAAKRAVTTARIEELAKPVVRASMDHVQFNPDAFIVKPFALNGSFPSRITSLAKPIDR